MLCATHTSSWAPARCCQGPAGFFFSDGPETRNSSDSHDSDLNMNEGVPKRPARARWQDFKQRAAPPPGVIVVDSNGPLRKSAVGTVVGTLPPARQYVAPISTSVDLSSPLAIQLINTALLRSQRSARPLSPHESLSQPLSPIDSHQGSMPDSDAAVSPYLADFPDEEANIFSHLDVSTFGSYGCSPSLQSPFSDGNNLHDAESQPPALSRADSLVASPRSLEANSNAFGSSPIAGASSPACPSPVRMSRVSSMEAMIGHLALRDQSRPL